MFDIWLEHPVDIGSLVLDFSRHLGFLNSGTEESSSQHLIWEIALDKMVYHMVQSLPSQLKTQKMGYRPTSLLGITLPFGILSM